MSRPSLPSDSERKLERELNNTIIDASSHDNAKSRRCKAIALCLP